MDYSTFRRYYIDKIYRIIDHFAKFMNSSWKNFKNINIAFLIIFFSNFPSFRRMANLWIMEKREKKKNEYTTHIFILIQSYFQKIANSSLPFHHALSLQI